MIVAIVACMWLYGFIKIKCDWVKSPLEVANMNPISKSGAKTACTPDQRMAVEIAEGMKSLFGN